MPSSDKHAAKQRKKEANALAVQAFEHQTRAQAHAAADRNTEALAANALAIQQYTSLLNKEDTHLDALYNLGICELLQARLLRTTVAQAVRHALRAQAQTRFERVLAQDTSGRGEVSGLAHRTLAEMALQRSRNVCDDGLQSKAASDACTHFAEAERVLFPRTGIDAALLFHWGEATGVRMRCALGNEQMCSASKYAWAAASLYDRALTLNQTESATKHATVADTECLWAKASVLHEWCQAAVMEEADSFPTPCRMTKALSDAHDAAMAFLHLVYPDSILTMSETTTCAKVVIDAVTAAMHELTTTDDPTPASSKEVASLADAHCLCGDLCDLSAQHAEGQEVRHAYLVRAARHYAYASAKTPSHAYAWQGLGEACFELLKNAAFVNNNTDTLRVLHHHAEACFHRALRVMESTSTDGQSDNAVFIDAHECICYNLACLAAMCKPFDAKAERACREWVQRCVDYDTKVVLQMANDPDLQVVHTRGWFRALSDGYNVDTTM